MLKKFLPGALPGEMKDAKNAVDRASINKVVVIESPKREIGV